MSRTKRRSIPAIVAALGLGGALGTSAFAADTQPTLEELRAQNAALMARIEKLEKQQQAQEEKLDSGVVDATVRAVMQDSKARSQLLAAEGFTAGHDKGKFLIQSADGTFSLNPNVQFQFRYVGNYAEDNSNTGDDDYQDGFTVRRLKLGLEGNLWSKDFKYNFVWATNRAGGGLILEDAFVTYNLPQMKELTIKAGQYKDPTFHEETTSSKRQLAVDRSLVNERLGGGLTDRIQAVSAIWASADMPLSVEVGFGDGVNTDNTDFADGGGTALADVASPNWGGFARAEFVVMGDKKAYADFTAMGNKEDLLVLGAGASYTDAGGYALFHTFDAQFETGPIGAYVAYYGISHENGDSAYDWGAIAQIGYMIDAQLEVFGRAGWIDVEAEDEFCEWTFGANYYFHGHSSKMTADITWLPDGSPDADSGIGVVASDQNQFVFRLQYQLLL